ncbi:cystatin-A-like [Homarus americanus]|uniref:cystatin-A-like n=1 Tax=Homarus americanus TaxID=6706 RepID=UPI001C491B52|nr:cystatin-A-like [Homarus americanus]XP_042227814.1 cystatin-A-like [Homarus americanus]
MLAGGTTETKPPCDEVQQLLIQVKGQVEDKLGREVSQFTLLSYKTQVVAGTNYFAKVDIGEEEVVHMRVYKDLKQNLSLHSIQHPKAKEDDIAYF